MLNDTSPWFCTECGSPGSSATQFCAACGSPRRESPHESGRAEPNGKRTAPIAKTKTGSSPLIPLVAICGVALVVAAFVVGLALRSESSSPPGTTEVAITTTSTTSSSTTSIPAVRPSTPTTLAPSATPPVLGSGDGQWVAILASLADSASTASVDAEFNAINSELPGVLVLRSSDYSSLRPGYIVIYKGTFSSQDEANQYCSNAGRAIPSQCYGRLVKR
jgi:hypothetical protein